jgi:hypothetical protein
MGLTIDPITQLFRCDSGCYHSEDCLFPARDFDRHCLDAYYNNHVAPFLRSRGFQEQNFKACAEIAAWDSLNTGSNIIFDRL